MEPRPVPFRQCPGAARQSRPCPTVVLALAYPGTPQSQSSNPRGLKTRTLLHQLCPHGGWDPSQDHRAAGVGVGTGGRSGVGGVPWTVLGPESAGTGPLPVPDRLRGGRHLGAELNGVDFGEDRPGEKEPGPAAWSGARSPEPRPQIPRPSDFVLDLSQSSGTRSGLYWVTSWGDEDCLTP